MVNNFEHYSHTLYQILEYNINIYYIFKLNIKSEQIHYFIQFTNIFTFVIEIKYILFYNIYKYKK